MHLLIPVFKPAPCKVCTGTSPSVRVRDRQVLLGSVWASWRRFWSHSMVSELTC